MTTNFNMEYQLTVKDLIEARQLVSSKARSYKFNLFVLAIILFYIAIVIFRIDSLKFLVSGVYYSASSGDRFWNIFTMASFFLLYLDKTFPKLNPLTRWKIIRNYQRNFVQQELRQVSISATGISIVSKSYRQDRQWSNIERTVENKKLFLLYHSRDAEYTIMTKGIFKSEPELANFRNLLNKKN